jgi:hypothetical protein
MVLRSDGVLPHRYTTSQPRRQRLESSPPWKPRTSHTRSHPLHPFPCRNLKSRRLTIHDNLCVKGEDSFIIASMLLVIILSYFSFTYYYPSLIFSSTYPKALPLNQFREASLNSGRTAFVLNASSTDCSQSLVDKF